MDTANIDGSGEVAPKEQPGNAAQASSLPPPPPAKKRTGGGVAAIVGIFLLACCVGGILFYRKKVETNRMQFLVDLGHANKTATLRNRLPSVKGATHAPVSADAIMAAAAAADYGARSSGVVTNATYGAAGGADNQCFDSTSTPAVASDLVQAAAAEANYGSAEESYLEVAGAGMAGTLSKAEQAILLEKHIPNIMYTASDGTPQVLDVPLTTNIMYQAAGNTPLYSVPMEGAGGGSVVHDGGGVPAYGGVVYTAEGAAAPGTVTVTNNGAANNFYDAGVPPTAATTTNDGAANNFYNVGVPAPRQVAAGSGTGGARAGRSAYVNGAAIEPFLATHNAESAAIEAPPAVDGGVDGVGAGAGGEGGANSETMYSIYTGSTPGPAIPNTEVYGGADYAHGMTGAQPGGGRSGGFERSGSTQSTTSAASYHDASYYDPNEAATNCNTSGGAAAAATMYAVPMEDAPAAVTIVQVYGSAEDNAAGAVVVPAAVGGGAENDYTSYSPPAATAVNSGAPPPVYSVPMEGEGGEGYLAVEGGGASTPAYITSSNV
jgi:hypothetical protein